MAALEWDKVGERFYHTGVDRGVLYLRDGTAVVWNGITSVDAGTNSDLQTVYMDGVKISERVTSGEFVGKLSAFTYPDEFDKCLGIIEPGDPGLSFHEQHTQSFGLTYRTKIGNDLEADDYAYRIHILWNLSAIPDSHVSETLQDSGQAGEFSWALSARPDLFHNYRPTGHVSIDSVKSNPSLLQELEDILYGTDETDPRLPEITEVGSIFGAFGALIIIDHGDGTWTADDPTDTYLSMLSPTSFQIEHADATFSDPDTYDISSTNL